MWTSVKDKLPEEVGIYLVMDKYGNIDVGNFNKEFDVCGCCSECNDYYITHWMPLPEKKV
jgi:hypothetical protein